MISGGNEYYAFVQDSSVIHRADPKLDGKRLITACTPEHGRRLIEKYKARPFVEPELWAGKIGRALSRHPEGLSEEALAEETGLTPAQIEVRVLWKDVEAVRWHERFGKDQGPNLDEGPDGEEP